MAVERVGIDQVIEIQKFSDLYKLFRVTSYVLRFVKAIRKRGSGLKRKCVEPDLEEMNRAEALWNKKLSKLRSRRQKVPTVMDFFRTDRGRRRYLEMSWKNRKCALSIRNEVHRDSRKGRPIHEPSNLGKSQQSNAQRSKRHSDGTSLTVLDHARPSSCKEGDSEVCYVQEDRRSEIQLCGTPEFTGLSSFR